MHLREWIINIEGPVKWKWVKDISETFTFITKKRVSISFEAFVPLINELGETLANEFTSVVMP